MATVGVMPPSNCSGCNASVGNATAGTAVSADALHFGSFSSGTGVLLLVRVLAVVLLVCVCWVLRRRGWRLRLARRPFLRTEDVQLTDLGDWMATDDGDDVTIGGPLSRPHVPNGQGAAGLPQGIFASPSKGVDTEYFDLATPRQR
mmetsp:Transcript_69397/g.206735  ORF Transcript_69397/g.206735 Transcript_69397/m.206735 type:complete len:146 (-) Transcript_69397:235-672(-)